MKKEEFPTFLNEQPTIIFGRTGRELLIIAIGLSMGYMLWGHLSAIISGATFATTALKLLLTIIPIIISAVVALTSVGGRPLEEWAFVGIFYFLTPKVYIYMPFEEKEMDDEEIANLVKQGSKSQNNQEDEDY